MTSFFASQRTRFAVVLAAASAAPLGAQTIAQRLSTADRPVQVVYPSRQTACGDGRSYIGHVFEDGYYFGTDDNTMYQRGDGWSRGACVHGPARVVATVFGGEVTRLRVYVGPVPPPSTDMETVNASASDAAAWLTSLVTGDNARVAASAILPLILVDAPDPWPLLLRVARDNSRGLSVRRDALMWLGTGAIAHLGIEQKHDDTPDDEMRAQAVFVLSQRPKSESVPTLMDLAKSTKYPSARRSAIFWLGQTGDTRAADVFAELLGLR
ncbi:MAG TPA: HEAT repeat domain-containing protein [Gemmatimonadaceae bacterium]